LIDGESGEKELTILFHQKNPRDKGEWFLIRGKTRDFLEQIPPENIIKKAATLQFLVTFICFNSLYRPDTVLLLRSDQHQSIRDFDLRHLLHDLSNYLSQVDVSNIPNDQLLCSAEILQLFLIVDFGNPVPTEIFKGNLKDCKTPEKSAEFFNRRMERIRALTSIYLTSWGELFCKTYSGLSCLNRALAELAPQVSENEANKENFLKVFIPGSRRDLTSLPWLTSYIIKSLKVRHRELSSPAAV